MAESQAKRAAPKGSKGYVSTAIPGWMPFDPNEDNPDLLWPNSVRTFTQMRRRDARVSSVFRAVGLPVRRTPWRIDKNGASDEVTEFVAAELGLQRGVERGDGGPPRDLDAVQRDRDTGGRDDGAERVHHLCHLCLGRAEPRGERGASNRARGATQVSTVVVEDEGAGRARDLRMVAERKYKLLPDVEATAQGGVGLLLTGREQRVRVTQVLEAYLRIVPDLHLDPAAEHGLGEGNRDPIGPGVDGVLVQLEEHEGLPSPSDLLC